MAAARRLASAALLVLLAAAAARAQDIVDNPAPKNGDVCRDAGDLWRNIKLGPCEAGTKCQAYKRGELSSLSCCTWVPPAGRLAQGRGKAKQTAQRQRVTRRHWAARALQHRQTPSTPSPPWPPGSQPSSSPTHANTQHGTHQHVTQSTRPGVYKCVSTNPEMGALPLGAVCYDEHKVDNPAPTRTTPEAEGWRKYYRERNCVFEGVDRQGTPTVQCIQTKEDTKIYKCGRILPLDGPGCYTVAGSQIWGKWNDNQMYDACNGCPCTPPGKVCKSPPCKYPACRCNEPCTAERRAQKCATS